MLRRLSAHEQGPADSRCGIRFRERDLWSPSCAPRTDEVPVVAQTAREYNQGSVLLRGSALTARVRIMLTVLHYYDYGFA